MRMSDLSVKSSHITSSTRAGKSTAMALLCVKCTAHSVHRIVGCRWNTLLTIVVVRDPYGSLLSAERPVLIPTSDTVLYESKVFRIRF